MGAVFLCAVKESTVPGLSHIRGHAGRLDLLRTNPGRHQISPRRLAPPFGNLMIRSAETHLTDKTRPLMLHPQTNQLIIGRHYRMQMSPFGDIMDDGRDAMSLESIIKTPAAAGAIIRARRTARGLSQEALADLAGVSRKFLIDLEAGHDRAQLGKTMAVLAALGLALYATDPIPRGSDHDPARRDYARTFTQLLAERDFEFAIKMLADYATASLTAGTPLLQRSPRLKDQHWTAALAGITNYTAHRLGQPAPAWTRRIKPLEEAWMPAQSYRTIREPMKKLTMSETPHELADLNVFIRERSLANA